MLCQNGLTQIFGGFVAYVRHLNECMLSLVRVILRQGISFYSGEMIATWKIIYILLGGLAVLVGVCVLIWMPDSPVHAHFLTPEERIAALERVRDDQVGVANRTLKKEQVIEALTDIRTWLIVLTTLLSTYHVKQFLLWCAADSDTPL
jgi:MFS transporter, ACS family, allantoate permease